MHQETEIHFETIAIANMMLTKHLFQFVAAKQLLDDEELGAVLTRAINDVVRSTLPISEEGAKQALRLILAGTGLDKSHLM